MNKKIVIVDSTLRDGAQAEGISFSVQDKLKIVRALDELGIDVIEAGNPSSNPKDAEFFACVGELKLRHSKLAAFGATRRHNTKVEEDAGLKSLLSANTGIVVIFGKSWDLHVTEIIKTTLDENLAMITETIVYLKSCGRQVVYDAEHFFDGYKHNSEYALRTLSAAKAGGADSIVLCDTNGGCFPSEVANICAEVVKLLGDTEIGIHAHNDTGMAEANAIMAVEAGARQVQGTILGFGERCGNSNLATLICDLQLKLGYKCIPADNIKNIVAICRKVSEISNKKLNNDMPYVGKSAFAHKAGMHIDGVTKLSASFEHISPESVGNSRRFLMSEVAGRSTVLDKVRAIDPSINKNDEVMYKIIDQVKKMEYAGYQFEGAEASFDLLIRKQLGTYKPFFILEKFKTIGEQLINASYIPATAMVKVTVNGISEMTAAEGEGPVNALDKALRKSLENFYPALKAMHLVDFKVRILDGKDATGAATRVLIESTDGNDIWSTVGVSRDIIEASLIAFVDAIEYKLIKDTVLQ